MQRPQDASTVGSRSEAKKGLRRSCSAPAMASVDATMKAINDACRSRGGHYATYSCKVVSWDDVSRGTVGGALSCWGANITDTYLKSKSGAPLFTVRSDNWNEKLGVVSADEVAVVASRPGSPLQPVTLRSVLQQMGTYGNYAGLEGQSNLSDAALDAQCSIRFQTTFLPVEDSKSGSKSKLEFATEAYNYNTTDDSDPRNMVLLCTSQGMAVQQDGRGAKKLFHHAVDDEGKIHRYWLEAEESRHEVGGEQRETDQERAEALARGKATSSVIGIRAMGQRFNVLMTIQVPLEQKPRPQRTKAPKAAPFIGVPWGMFGGAVEPQKAKAVVAAKKNSAPFISGMPFGMFGGGAVAYTATAKCAVAEEMDDICMQAMPANCMAAQSAGSVPCLEQASSLQLRKRCLGGRELRKGKSSAARVSRGTEQDVWKGLSVKSPKRNASEHVTVTVVIYNAVKGGVPTPDDVAAAIDDLESLYRACSDRGRLAESKFDFMKEQLTVDDMVDIGAKLKFQPPAVEVLQHNVFPTA